jgi:hypothetical protein
VPVVRKAGLLLLSVAVAACAAESGDSTGDVSPPAGMPDAAADSIPAPVPPEAADSAEAPSDPWAVSVTGAGDIRIGMRLPDLMPYLAEGTDTTGIGGGCRFVSVTGAPDSVGFMVESGRLARIDVRGGPTPTAEGARVGDEESRIEELYPDLRRMPHKYTDGNYLIVIPIPGDTLHRYVFETDGERVTQYRAGVYPQVEWVEGCA